MQKEKIKEIFDNMAPEYDKQADRTTPINNMLHFFMEAAFTGFPETAEILCVGAGTGAELVFLAGKFPGFKFTAVDPSYAMLDKCRSKAEKSGFTDRCSFHEGYVETLRKREKFDAATCILVSHFISEKIERISLFKSIAEKIKPGGFLISTDLSSDINSDNFELLLSDWAYAVTGEKASSKKLDEMRNTYKNDVSVLPGNEIEEIIRSAGFKKTVPFFQAGLISGWKSIR